MVVPGASDLQAHSQGDGHDVLGHVAADAVLPQVREGSGPEVAHAGPSVRQGLDATLQAKPRVEPCWGRRDGTRGGRQISTRSGRLARHEVCECLRRIVHPQSPSRPAALWPILPPRSGASGEPPLWRQNRIRIYFSQSRQWCLLQRRMIVTPRLAPSDTGLADAAGRPRCSARCAAEADGKWPGGWRRSRPWPAPARWDRRGRRPAAGHAGRCSR